MKSKQKEFPSWEGFYLTSNDCKSGITKDVLPIQTVLLISRFETPTLNSDGDIHRPVFPKV